MTKSKKTWPKMEADNGTTILALIERIATTTSKNDKTALIKANSDSELFKKVLLYTYNRFWTFGVKHYRLIEVRYHEVTPDGSLRHPRFVRFRDDKDRKLGEAAK